MDRPNESTTSQQLDEKYVQEIAVKWLASYYQHRRGIIASVFEREAVIWPPKKSEWGRPDGLVVCQRSDGRTLTAALEAKSIRTIGQVHLSYDDDRWVFHALIASSIIALAAIIVCWSSDFWFWRWVFPVLIFFGTAIGYLYLTNGRYRMSRALNQIKRYPANLRWIAVSSDLYNSLKRESRVVLRNRCRRSGIGLLQVKAEGEVDLVETARLRRNCPDCLHRYARASIIRKKLNARVEEFRQAKLASKKANSTLLAPNKGNSD